MAGVMAVIDLSIVRGFSDKQSDGKYNVTYRFERINEAKVINPENCNDILFLNNGSVTMYIEDFVLLPQRSLHLGNLQDCIIKTSFNIKSA